MKKNIIKLTVTVTLAAALAACDSGGSTSNNSTTALVITAVTAPTGSAPAQNLAAGMGSGSVFVNTTTGNPLYLLGNATGSVFAPLTADLSMTTGTSIIGAWLTSTNRLFGPAPSAADVAVYFSANLTLPLSTTTNNTAAWESATLTNINRTICFGNPIAGSNGCAGSNAPTGARLVASNSGNTQFMFVGYGQPGVLGAESIGYNALSNISGAGTPLANEAYVSLASCTASGSATVAGQSATTVSAIAASSFESNPLFIAGTNSGDVCVGIIPSNAESTAFANASLVNLTAVAKLAGASYNFESAPVAVTTTQATGGYNNLGAVNAIAATPQGSNNTNTIIAWTQGTSGVYSATMTSSASEAYTFANLLDTTKYANSPSGQQVSVIYVDFNNNIYVGTFSNQVYVLPNGSTNWLNVAIPNPLAGSQIYNFSAGYNGNVYAYTANGSASAVYSLSFL